MSHGVVKDQWARREVVVFSTRLNDVILDLDVTVFVSGRSGLSRRLSLAGLKVITEGIEMKRPT